MKTSRETLESLRTRIIELSTEEKEKYNLYLQLCKYYGIQPDPLATAAWQAKNQILSRLLDGKKM